MKPETKKRLAGYLLFAQISIYALIVLHSILWYVFGVHVITKLCPFAFRDHVSNLEFNLTVVFWILIFISTLFLGRVFCAWGCMFGAFQDFISRFAKLIKIKPINNKGFGKWLVRGILALLLAFYVFGLGSTMNWPSFFWFTAGITLIGLMLWIFVERKPSENRINTLPKYVFLALYLGGIIAAWISLNVFKNGITLAFGKYDVLHDIQGVLAFVVILVAVGVLTGEKRMFCRYLCPVGLLLRFFSAIPFPVKFKVSATKEKCVKCGKCNKECVMGITPMEELNGHGIVKSPECINCLVCVSTCPKNAIEVTNIKAKNGNQR